MPFHFAAADAVAPADLHRAFTDAFSDYLIGPFRLALEQWPTLLGRQCVDLAQSRVAMDEGAIAAFAFVAPREDIGWWRLATMGSPPAHRGSGAAPALLDDFIARADAAGCGAELECFEQNERALRLYRSRGFEAVSPLFGYSHLADAGDASDAPALEETALADAFAWIDALPRRAQLPLQVTPPSLRALPLQLHAQREGAAQIVWSAPAEGAVVIHSLIDTHAAQADAQSLAARLLRAHPGRDVSVPQLQRPDAGGDALERIGFARLPFNQLLMRRPRAG